jgi:hypothetical protein
MGKAEGQVRAKEDLSASEEGPCTETDESGSAEEVVGARESAVGGGEEGGR